MISSSYVFELEELDVHFRAVPYLVSLYYSFHRLHVLVLGSMHRTASDVLTTVSRDFRSALAGN